MAYESENEEGIKFTAHSYVPGHGKTAPVITVDYERYAHMLEGSDLTEDQKREFLQAVWNIIVEFVSLGFGVHPLQQAQKACGEAEEISPISAPMAPDKIYLDHKLLIENFEGAADPETDGAAEGVES